ncbi:MAG: FecR domain-containing protein [Duncaniella sp.]|nr:FecR domain-containing protein [Duncaniella sp.]
MDRENRYLRFVVRHYRPDCFDTQKALARYKATHPSKRRIHWRTFAAGIAAMIAVCLATAYIVMQRRTDRPVVIYASATEVTYILPDSSEVILYPHSSLSYTPRLFDSDRRDVGMKGKVGFKVRHNPAAPFTVNASYGTVRVLGTQFTVDETRTDSVTEVSVTSGRVLFTAAGYTEGVVLTRGMEATLTVGDSVPDVASAIPPAAAPRRFVFTDTPLSEVLKTLSGHFNVRLSCQSEGKTLTAEFDTADLDLIIRMIEKSLNVTITKDKDTE